MYAPGLSILPDTAGEPFSLTARRCATRFSGMRWLAGLPAGSPASRILMEVDMHRKIENNSMWGHLLLPILTLCLHSSVVREARTTILFFQKLLEAREHHSPILF